MPSAPMRAFLGFVAGAISVLTFHQGMIALLHTLGASSYAPYRIGSVPPFGVPIIVDLCFWGGLYGLVFGLLMPRFTWPHWLCGLALGFISVLIGMFVVAPLKGNPIAHGGHLWPIGRTLLINGFWGVGVGVLLPMLLPRTLVKAHGERQLSSR